MLRVEDLKQRIRVFGRHMVADPGRFDVCRPGTSDWSEAQAICRDSMQIMEDEISLVLLEKTLFSKKVKDAIALTPKSLHYKLGSESGSYVWEDIDTIQLDGMTMYLNGTKAAESNEVATHFYEDIFTHLHGKSVQFENILKAPVFLPWCVGCNTSSELKTRKFWVVGDYPEINMLGSGALGAALLGAPLLSVLIGGFKVSQQSRETLFHFNVDICKACWSQYNGHEKSRSHLVFSSEESTGKHTKDFGLYANEGKGYEVWIRDAEYAAEFEKANSPGSIPAQAMQQSYVEHLGARATEEDVAMAHLWRRCSSEWTGFISERRARKLQRKFDLKCPVLDAIEYLDYGMLPRYCVVSTQYVAWKDSGGPHVVSHKSLKPEMLSHVLDQKMSDGSKRKFIQLLFFLSELD